jgi:hypothetical protein
MSKANVGQVQVVSNCFKPEEVHLLLSLWSDVRSYRTSAKQLRTTLGHNGYYMKFIKGYVQITKPMEKILRKDCQFHWT